ncbi:hypothetical protein P389DRAFT_170405 [Cystobasidium minutum MCA 4210]|uniref:uncharacterized protein n=1 Tax=Cystobasidium minutum MCA 4210 TaxID=1397322 RepID=UPI0034CD326F|eukprot:jgi/Rhomi1/170405/fgenesh1_kg.4_\
MSNLDCSAALQPCNCNSNQYCIQIGRSSTECAKNTCVDKGSSGSGGKGGSSVGAVAGQAVGGVIGGLIIIVVVYFLWKRRRTSKGAMSSSGRPGFSLFNAHSKGPINTHGSGLRNYKLGQGKASPTVTEEKSLQHPHSAGTGKTYNPSPLRNVTSTPGPGEEDAQSIKRQSLRFDPSNNGTRTSRRSLSGAAGALINISDNNPFEDPSDENAQLPNASSRNNDNRESGITESEFSYRSSHSTNIIPIAYIPAHASQNSTIDMHGDSRRPHSMSSNTLNGRGSHMRNDSRITSGAPMSISRASRASVPLSLRSNSTGNMHDSMNGATFSTLFDRRTSTHGGAAVPGRDGLSSPGMLEIIAPNMGATSPPALTTPTMTKDGRPIRPPRAPGLDLKLPTPESISPPPPTSPASGFPWGTSIISHNGPPSAASFSTSPGAQSQQKSFAAMQAALIASANVGNDEQPQRGRETLLSPSMPNHHPGRSSAYSTISQSTDNSGSHLSYILAAPQIVTPKSAGHVQVQTLTRAAAKAVKLPHSNSGNAIAAGASNSPSSPGRDLSPLADNPFDDDAAVHIAIPSPSSSGGHSIPLTPTFGGVTALPSPDHQQQQRESNVIVPEGGLRMSMATTNTRRDSDLSIFTSSVAHNDGDGGFRRTARNSFASSFASSHQNPRASMSSGGQGRAPSPSSFAGTAGHSGASNKSNAPSVHSASSADEVILAPPNRPFVSNENNGGDSRHTSAALSMRSGYGSVLDGIPFNLALSPEARNSQASSSGMGPHMSIPFTFGGSIPQHQSMARRPSDAATSSGGVRDSSVTYRTSMASSSMHGDKRDTTYSLASEWNGAFGGMPIQMGNIAEEAVPEVPSMYRQSTASAAGADTAAAKTESKEETRRTSAEMRDGRYSSDSLALAAAVARQFDDDGQ